MRIASDPPLAAVRRLGEPAVVALVTACLGLAYYRLFVLPMVEHPGGIGADYTLFFPLLLTGYYWYLGNGVFEIPWFSPHACGGVPYYADPNVGWFSLPQWLAFVMPPLGAVITTLAIFAAIGFFGSYWLARRAFRLSIAAALATAALFLFNGFFIARMSVGHLTYHAYGLTPLVAAIVLAPAGAAGFGRTGWVLRGGAVALAVAYMFHAGMVHIVPPVLLSVVVAMLVHATRFGFGWRPFAVLTIGIVGALPLIAGRLVAEMAFLAQFPRDQYALPGIRGLATTTARTVWLLFFGAPKEAPEWASIPGTIIQSHHEWDYSVSPVALILILLGALAAGISRARLFDHRLGRLARAALSLAIVGGLLIPVLLNWHEPAWTGWLKSLPYFGNSSTLLRWFSALILPAILAAGLGFDRIVTCTPAVFRPPAGPILAVLSLAGLVGWNASLDRTYYENQHYDPDLLDRAWRDAQANGQPVPIAGTAIHARDPMTHRVVAGVNGNDLMILGGSQLQCYQPIFGYGLENFPKGHLHSGLATELDGGEFNFKNPACYVFPEENACVPGDPFKESERASMEALLAYRPYPFVEPAAARIANYVSLIAFLATLAAMLAASSPSFLSGVARAAAQPGSMPNARK